MEKSIPKGLIYPETVEIIERNGGEVGPQEIILRDIQQERPFFTGATMVIFKSGEYVCYNERGTWNDVRPSKAQGSTRIVAYACREDQSSETIILRNKGFVLLLPLYTSTDNTKREVPEIAVCSPTGIPDRPASSVALMGTQCQDKLCAKIGVNSASRFPRARGPPGLHRATQPAQNRYQVQ